MRSVAAVAGSAAFAIASAADAAAAAVGTGAAVSVPGHPAAVECGADGP